MTVFLASAVFALGYLFITLEAKLKVNKSAFALAMGGILWVILALHDQTLAHEEMVHTAYDIFSIVVFLLAAMSLVEILVHYRFFDVVRSWILKYRLTDRSQFVAVCSIAFVLSAIIDNLTTTIVMVQIARKFFKGDNLLIAAVGVVIAANAGGAFSPIGDVTTIMLWLAGKFDAGTIILQGFLPSVALLGVATFFMLPRIVESGYDATDDAAAEPLSWDEKAVIGSVGFSFLLPVLVKMIGLPPVVGILLGLGLTWLLIDVLRSVAPSKTNLSASIEHLIQKTDLSSIKFFIGILLAVSVLGSLGILDRVSTWVYGSDQGTVRIIAGNVVLGVVSSFLDNIPLTAIAIDMLDVADPSLWVLLALAVGTGGSLLAFGSAAGVVATGLIKELTFERYFRIAFVPALLGFLAAMGVWLVQFSLLA